MYNIDNFLGNIDAASSGTTLWESAWAYRIRNISPFLFHIIISSGPVFAQSKSQPIYWQAFYCSCRLYSKLFIAVSQPVDSIWGINFLGPNVLFFFQRVGLEINENVNVYKKSTYLHLTSSSTSKTICESFTRVWFWVNSHF